MNIDEWMLQALGRELTPFEGGMVNRLSAQGIAKLNSDLAKGADPESTMREFRVVFRALLRRRERLLDSLSPMARNAVRQLESRLQQSTCLAPLPVCSESPKRRSAVQSRMTTEDSAAPSSPKPSSGEEAAVAGIGITTEELAYLHVRWGTNPLSLRLQGVGGFPKELDLNEEAEMELQRQMERYAKQLALQRHALSKNDGEGGRVIIMSRLAATVSSGCPLSSPLLLVPENEPILTVPSSGVMPLALPSMVRYGGLGKVFVGLNPIATWFDEFPKTPLKVSWPNCIFQSDKKQRNQSTGLANSGRKVCFAEDAMALDPSKVRLTSPPNPSSPVSPRLPPSHLEKPPTSNLDANGSPQSAPSFGFEAFVNEPVALTSPTSPDESNGGRQQLRWPTFLARTITRVRSFCNNSSSSKQPSPGGSFFKGKHNNVIPLNVSNDGGDGVLLRHGSI